MLLLIFCAIKVSAQGHYSLEIGNLWEFWEPGSPDTYLGKIKALKDTTMPNGEKYVFLKSDPFWNDEYQRVNGSRVFWFNKYINSEEVLYDFSKSVGDTISIIHYPYDTLINRLIELRTQYVFGVLRTQWVFYQNSVQSSMYIRRIVTDSIGLTYFIYEPGVEQYLRGAIINSTTYGTVTDVRLAPNIPQAQYEIFQNYPNPFNSSTIIRFRVVPDDVSVTIFDMMGRQVKKLFEGELVNDLPHLIWDGKNDFGKAMGSGTYIYQVKAKSFMDVKKMILIR
ncbi:MAG: T9SS type A sorting domain-containing protein [Bacteroidota bacterium]|nr:T9SS type A sorting domain-containing protein [Bacteroidota bacterium]